MRLLHGWTLACLLFLAGWTLSAADDITGFKCVGFDGECTYKTDAGLQPLEKDKVYPWGTELHTGRGAYADLAFLPVSSDKDKQNTFRLLARTVLVVSQDVKNPKLMRLAVSAGGVDLKLDSFPKGSQLQVETPSAVCGAVGTRFKVTYEGGDTDEETVARQGSHENRFDCSKGAVFVASHFAVKDTTVQGEAVNVGQMKAGSALVAVIHAGAENTYTDITVNRGRLDFDIGGQKGAALEAKGSEDKPVRFVCALEKSDSDVTTTALEVKSGELTNRTAHFQPDDHEKVKETTVTPKDGPVVVDHQVLKKREDTVVADYLAAAKTEGELATALDDKVRAGQPVTDAEHQAVKAAAKAASKLRQSLLVGQTIKTLNLIHQSIAPPRIPIR